jgi:hypothetical protein
MVLRRSIEDYLDPAPHLSRPPPFAYRLAGGLVRLTNECVELALRSERKAGDGLQLPDPFIGGRGARRGQAPFCRRLADSLPATFELNPGTDADALGQSQAGFAGLQEQQ